MGVTTTSPTPPWCGCGGHRRLARHHSGGFRRLTTPKQYVGLRHHNPTPQGAAVVVDPSSDRHHNGGGQRRSGGDSGVVAAAAAVDGGGGHDDGEGDGGAAMMLVVKEMVNEMEMGSGGEDSSGCRRNFAGKSARKVFRRRWLAGKRHRESYNVVPSPHPLILNRPTPLDLSYSGLEEFKEPEVNEYGPRDSSVKPTIGCNKESNNSKENTDDSLEQPQKTGTETSSVKSSLKVDKDWKEKFFCPAKHVREVELKKVRENNDAPIIEDWVSDDEDDDESNPKVEKKTVIPTATKKEFVKPEKQVKRSVRYAEMYRTQIPRGNQRNWNGQKSNQLGCNFVFNNKACFICGSFDHIQYSCPNQQRKRIVSGNNYNKKDNDYYSKTSHSSAHKHMVPRAVLMKTGLKSINTASPVNNVRSANTGRPFSTARSFNTVRPSSTTHPKSTIHCARPRTYFQNQAQSTVHRPFYKRIALTKRCFNQRLNTGRSFRSTVNTVRARGFNVVKPLACWVWRPIKPNGASLSNSQLNEKGFVDSGCSRHMTGNIAHLSDFKNFDRGYVTFGGGAYGGRITGKGIQGDASYFGDALPKTIADAQIEDTDEFHNEDDATEESHDDSSLKDNGTADQQVNTARPEINTGSREVSTALPEVNTATPEDLVGPSPASDDTQVEVQDIELGNIPPSYTVPTTPHTRIHKDHPIEHVIGNVQSSVQTRRMKTSYSEQGFLSAIYEGKTHQDLHTCLFVCFLSQEKPKRVSKALSDPAWVVAMQEELLMQERNSTVQLRKDILKRRAFRLLYEVICTVLDIEAYKMFWLMPPIWIYGLQNGLLKSAFCNVR
ncbi:hypothetical protein Tco_0500794 [Tanacetum coccineum]